LKVTRIGQNLQVGRRIDQRRISSYGRPAESPLKPPLFLPQPEFT
jgi:hypothetical protein